jgi:purine-binding chemotaxis protein CheW
LGKEVAMTNEHQPAVSSTLEGKYLTFSLAGEEFGIGILKVKEIIGIMSITPVPRTPEAVQGVINLRGKVIPIIDLRLKFGLPEVEPTERTCIVVVDVTTNKQALQMGVVVDSVSEVLNVKAEEIEGRPEFGSSVGNTDYIIGMAKTQGGVKILMDIDKVLAAEDITAAFKAAS